MSGAVAVNPDLQKAAEKELDQYLDGYEASLREGLAKHFDVALDDESEDE